MCDYHLVTALPPLLQCTTRGPCSLRPSLTSPTTTCGFASWRYVSTSPTTACFIAVFHRILPHHCVVFVDMFLFPLCLFFNILMSYFNCVFFAILYFSKARRRLGIFFACGFFTVLHLLHYRMSFSTLHFVTVTYF